MESNMAMLPKPADGVYRNHAVGCTDEYEHPGSCRLDDGQPRGSKTAYDLAAQLPVRDDDPYEANAGDLISLVDIVITGVEHHEWHHFGIHGYDPDASGSSAAPWATLRPLKDSAKFVNDPDGGHDEWVKPVNLTEATVRKAVELYIDDRLKRGMPLQEVARMVDGSYTDVVVADSILQFALYGEEVYG